MTAPPSPAPSRVAGRRRTAPGALPILGAAAFFAAVAVAVTWPLAPQAAGALRDAGDPALFIWTLHWLAQAALHDPAHLYAGPIFHGFPNPVTYTDTSLLPGILGAPLWLSDHRVLFFNLLLLATLALDGLTAYMLIAALTGSRAGGLIGGLVTMVNGYTLAHLSHLNILSAYWVPLALLALHRLFHPGPAGPRPRWAAVLGLAVIGQTLSTFYVLAYLLIAVVLYVAWQGGVRRAVGTWPGAWRRRLAGQLLLVGLAAGLVLVAVTLPYWQTQQVMGFSRTLEDNLTWSAQPADFLSVSLHNRTYARLLPQADPEPLFAGFTALLLAAGGMVAAVRRRRTEPAEERQAAPAEFGFYGLLLTTGVILALGPQVTIGPWTIPLPYRLLALLPGAGALRAPVRAMALVNLALGVFAGLGATHLLALRLPGAGTAARGAGPVARHALRGLLLACLVALILVEQQVAPLALAPLPASAATQPAAYQWLAAHPDGGVLIEMPVGLGLRDPTVESTHMYYQTWHGHPLVGGYSGFRPPTYVEIYAHLDAQYDSFTAERLGILQSLGVRYLLYHEANYKRSVWARVAAGLAAFPQVQDAGSFPAGPGGPDHLYRLDPRPADAVIRVAAAPGPTAGTATVVLTNTGAVPLLTRLRPALDLALPDGRRLAVPAPLTLPPGSARFTVPLAGPALAAGTPLTPLAPAPDTLAPASAQDLP